MVDKSDFNGLAKVEVLKRPKITIRLESSVIDFTTLMKSLEKDEKKPANKDKQKRRLFSDDPLPFEAPQESGRRYPAEGQKHPCQRRAS